MNLILRIVLTCGLRIVTICTGAFVIPIAERLALGWVRYWTRGLPRDVRDRHVVEMRSDLFEQRRHDADGGYTHEQIAARILARLVRGASADLSRRRDILRAAKQMPSRQEEERPQTIRSAGIPTAAAVGAPTVSQSPTPPPIPPADSLHGTFPSVTIAVISLNEQFRRSQRAAIQAQLTTMWGDQVVFTSTPEAPVSITDTRPGTALPAAIPFTHSTAPTRYR